MESFTLFFQMLIGHSFGDWVFQQEAMGLGKNRNSGIHAQKGRNFPPWPYWLTGHALVHGGIVYFITGSAVFGLVETMLHWVIDFSKCEGWINVHQDQALHIVCKVGYVVVLFLR